MTVKKIPFSSQTVSYHFGGAIADLKKMVPLNKTVLVTDENVYRAHQKKFKGWSTIIIKAGEAFKVQATVDSIVEQLLHRKADRQTVLVGVGGGVVTDITGYAASIFMRGISFGFVPTTLLAMVDASIGGKNGIDVGHYKNMVGTIRQPHFLLYDVKLLKTLPPAEWCNGFAEVIKHAAIKDVRLFKELEEQSLKGYQKKEGQLLKLVQRNALLKTGVVQGDEFEKGERKLLNFGHTLGHALENQYNLMHGEAVAVGMVFAAKLSKSLIGFKQGDRLKKVIQKYGLPTDADYKKDPTFALISSDKKKIDDQMQFVLLQQLGKGVIHKISLEKLYQLL